MTLSPRALIRSFRSDLKLRWKLLLSYLVLIIVPFVIIAVVLAGRVSGIVEERIAYSAAQAFGQAGSFLEYKLYDVRKVSHIILVDPVVNAILAREGPQYDLREQRVDYGTLTDFFFSLQDGVTVERVRLYVPDERYYAEERINLFGLKEAGDRAWMRYLRESGSSSVWCPAEYLAGDAADGPPVLSLARYIPDLNDLRRNIGVLRVDFTKAQVVDILTKAIAVRDSLACVVNSKGDVVAASDARLMERFRMSLPVAEDSTEGQALRRVKTPAGEALVGTRALEGTDWRMAAVIPFAGIEAESGMIRNRVFLVILAIAAASSLAAYLISGSVTRRLSGIMERMRGFAKGGLAKLDLPAGRDEVGELALTYNTMIDEISSLLALEEHTQRELKRAELEALQAQINPHFLYNTLDMIKWMSRRGMADEIEELLSALATFYRLSLSEGRQTIAIRDELRHVELYARIQAMRYRGAIEFRIHVDPAILETGILKVTLQPLVENAIIHGICEKPEKRGLVTITGGPAPDPSGAPGGGVRLTVEDDGVGMTPEVAAAILDPGRQRRSGFGVRNIHERFSLFYGEGCGLSFDSAPGKGTRAHLLFATLPPEQKSPHD